MLLESKYIVGQKLYLITDRDQLLRIVTGILFRLSGIQYELACGSASSWHYDFEVSETKDVVTSTTS